MAKVAQYDGKGYYIGIAEDYDQGLPSNCTRVIPEKIDADKTPEDQPGWYNDYWPVFNGVSNSWEYLEDHRGETWYNGVTAIVIKVLGPIPEGLTQSPILTDDQIKKDLQQLREIKYVEVDQNRIRMWDAGVWYKGHLFQSRQKDRDIIASTLNAVNEVGWFLGSNYSWRSSEDIMVPFCHADLFMLNLYLLIQNEIVYNVSWRDKDVTLANFKRKKDIQEFIPTFLDTRQIQDLIDARLVPFKDHLDVICHELCSSSDRFKDVFSTEELVKEMFKKQ